MNNKFSWELFNQMPIIGIMRNISSAYTINIAHAFEQAGLTCLEVTMNSTGAEETIGSLVNTHGDKLNIGAGTVCTMNDLDRALNAGAQFIVTPIVNDDVIAACAAQKVPVFPGAYTPTEIYKAWSLGATMVKVFPATTLGTGYIREVLGPLSDISLVPTGGINLENFTGYLEAGAKAVGIGSHLFPKSILEQEDWDKLKEIYVLFTERYHTFIQSKKA
ncbi:bifunctional 4-hydroxy-2-oxoglutarate aldolase/2-dehydro-3-deoxy-phosphogluconate aldolase [Mucilaginibacter endophyticus]|uniref:bifunctional 4-hydroxy-2-oxoglutarate aldolase/2-dehydro-3-deoxy-phosphogluconate aldolase n=1 Tax=Mucilaginibacter endophyticus TaxID=2675003 RepID=UPI000E0D550B|nr:bifunctional 4-hydroxy-2-oxoglutarate aldolase/2-dehydro-3-deoxy-phosphogluconate aldolase [Mucilaginibacter endophyticus]